MDERANGPTIDQGDVLIGKTGRRGSSGFANAGTSERDSEEGGTEALGRQKETGCVYFVETEDGNFVNIGYFSTLDRHMRQLESALGLRRFA